jgi:NAD(P)-dependent dehydrogenase (short-subunit alcohol dehydrogenase family)
MDDQLLAGRVALVMGGGQLPGEDTGNGRAAALTFGRHGALVAVVDMSLASAEETANLISKEGGTAIAVQADVTNEENVIASVDTCVREYGRVDILHNNVGITAGGEIAELDMDTYDRVMAINLRGMVLSCRHTLPIMRKQQKATIVNISSVADRINHPSASYRISKAAVLTLTRHIAITNASFGIRANAILPGLVQTPMAVEKRVASGIARDDVLANRASRVPLSGAVGTAWDVANAALFFASDLAQFITGAELVIDGGQSLQVAP